MDKLTWEFQQMLNDNKDGSFATQDARKDVLFQTAKELKELGYNQMSVRSIRGKHYQKLVNNWAKKGLAPATMKNRMSHLRWQANKNGLGDRVNTNKELGIPDRVNADNKNKAVELKQTHLNKVTDQHTQFSLRLQYAFGLRRESAIKFNPEYSDKGDKVVLKPSTTKGGRACEIPIINPQQRDLLNELKNFVGNNSLIPADKSYKEQIQVYKNQVVKSDLGKAHGLRHKYAQDRYKKLTGKNCPACGGKRQRDMSPEERAVDRDARLQISSELGHSREDITVRYLGS